MPPGPDCDELAAGLKEKYDAGPSVRASAEETGRTLGIDHQGAVHRLLGEAAAFGARGGATREKAAA
ncbi:helix-turn-helix domain-containing protein [Streptomyces azureus]|uniref:helix-turn-helix domain-containing protein n=1 Tax=Streptomyces azureus TaxID=146537 RepID=UPI00099C2337|nr:helix-turn-helix domain-containing protein [Streptomyces azureus]